MNKRLKNRVSLISLETTGLFFFIFSIQTPVNRIIIGNFIKRIYLSKTDIIIQIGIGRALKLLHINDSHPDLLVRDNSNLNECIPEIIVFGQGKVSLRQKIVCINEKSGEEAV